MKQDVFLSGVVIKFSTDLILDPKILFVRLLKFLILLGKAVKLLDPASSCPSLDGRVRCSSLSVLAPLDAGIL